MTKPFKSYRVHIYPIMRVTLNIKAESESVALAIAAQTFDASPKQICLRAEYAEDIDCFLVDTLDGFETVQSVAYDKHGRPTVRQECKYRNDPNHGADRTVTAQPEIGWCTDHNAPICNAPICGKCGYCVYDSAHESCVR